MYLRERRVANRLWGQRARRGGADQQHARRSAAGLYPGRRFREFAELEPATGLPQIETCFLGRNHSTHLYSIGFGLLLIVAAVSLSPPVLNHLARDGTIDSGALRSVIWICDLLLVMGGAALLYYRPVIGGAEILLSLGAIVIMLLLLEVGVRGEWWEPPSRMEPSPLTGWVPIEHDSAKLVDPPFGRRTYSTGRDGFRRFGDTSSSLPKVLFLGDSFTHATEVSDGEAYYDVIAQRHGGVEIFAFGARGYSSLQEYLTLDALMDDVGPDLIVWQFASNDLITNDRALETRHWAYNNQQVRPYLEGDSTVQRLPIDHPLLRHSHLARFVAVRLDRLRVDDFGEEMGRYFVESPESGARAVRTTTRIMAMVEARAGSVPVVAFQVDRPVWLGDTYREVSQKAGIDFVTGIPDLIERAKRQGKRVDFSPRDGHWNSTGHALVGRALLDSLVAQQLLPPPRRPEDYSGRTPSP